LRGPLRLALLAAAISALYLYKLDGVGVLSADEPRYAAIGADMAHTGDLVTPKLWGSYWFEKPPLVYWMAATGTLAGLNLELAARLPVVLLSLAFLAVSFFLLRSEFGSEAAAVTTFLLATSAGWMAYSQLCLTDLPLAVFFSLSVFLSLPLLRTQPQTASIPLRFVALGLCLGLAVLAKALVPLALALPFFWFLRRFRRYWWLAILSCTIIALPWYWAAYSRNGYPFIQELFIKHHLERLYSPALQHVHSWYYYVPVLLIALFPWTPLLGLFAWKQPVWDERRRFLLVIFVFGFVIFSASLNKLPGYLLPLLPCVFTLIGAQFETRSISELSRWWLLASALLIGTIPMIAPILPESLNLGHFSSSGFHGLTLLDFLCVLIPILVALFTRPSWSGLLLVLCVVAGGIYMKYVAYPILDEQVSARGMWRRMKGVADRVCDGGTNRTWLFGLEFYRGSTFPVCGTGKFDFMLRSPVGTASPQLVPTRLSER